MNSASATGYSYRVTAKDVATGRVVTSFTTRAIPAHKPQQYYANERGFTAGPMPVQDIGVQLALEVMGNLTAVWAKKG